MSKMTLDELAKQLSAAFGSELRAIVLYGSAAAGEHIPNKSDYNVLVLVDSLAADRLTAASAAIRAWGEAGNPPPLTLTMDEWRGSADIFPMEYADVLERHKVLHGSLPTDIKIDPANLRLELEHEAMGTLLQLRRGALASGGDAKAQLALLLNSVSTIMVIYRAVLRLHHETPPTDNVRLCERVAAIAKLEAEPVIRVVKHKRGESPMRGADASAALPGYLAAQQQLVKYLDQYRRGS